MPKVNREQFLHLLQSCTPGLTQRETTSQSTCVAFRNGRVMTMSEHVACRAPSPLGKEFAGAVRGQKLLDALALLPEEEIDVDRSENEMLIKGKGSKLLSFTLESEISMPTNALEKVDAWTPIPDEFADAVGIVQSCASIHASEFNYTCVHLAPNWIEATDRFQISRYTLKTGVKESVLVKQDSIRHVATMGATEFAETDSWIHFRNAAKLTLSCRRYIEEYEDLSPYLEVEGKTVKTQLPKGLVKETEVANVFSSEHADNNKVQVDMAPGKVRIRGIGITGGYRSGWWKMRWAGKPTRFLIAPELLSKIIDKHPEVEMTEDRLMVRSERFVYLTVLGHPEVNGEAE